jgi:hypothetical protein
MSPTEEETAMPGCTLKDCLIEPEGGGVCLNVAAADGTVLQIRLSLDQLGSLAMTLPSLLERALRLRHADESLRYVFPLGSWNIEAAAGSSALILNLRTPDGFKASFGVPPAMAGQMALALAAERPPTGRTRTGLN